RLHRDADQLHVDPGLQRHAPAVLTHLGYLPAVHRAPPTIRTPRLVLRPFAREDAAAVAAVLDDAEVGMYLLHVPHPSSSLEALRWITAWTRRWLNGRGVALAITRAGKLAGAVTLTVQPDHRRAELGYWLGSAHWGRGLAPEAATALVDWG